MAGKRFVVGKADSIGEGQRRVVEINGRNIIIFRNKGQYYGLLDRCPHRGAPLSKGRLLSQVSSDEVGTYEFDGDKKLLACPWHGWEFDITTGRSYVDPRRLSARPFGVAVETGAVVREQIDAGEMSVDTPEEYLQKVDPSLTGGLVEGPFRAQTYDVEVEGEYLVVSLRPPRPPRPSRPNTRAEEGNE